MTQPYFSLIRLSEIVRENLMESADLKITMAQKDSETIGELAKQIAYLIEHDQTIFIFGNGGSAADAQHFAGELVGMCKNRRQPLPVLALSTNTSTLTAISNDFGFSEVFSRQILALGKPGDLVIGISTSGNSENVVEGINTANGIGLTTVALTGNDGGKLKEIADFSIVIPSSNVLRIQEVHITILHIVADLVEGYYYKKENKS